MCLVGTASAPVPTARAAPFGSAGAAAPFGSAGAEADRSAGSAEGRYLPLSLASVGGWRADMTARRSRRPGLGPESADAGRMHAPPEPGDWHSGGGKCVRARPGPSARTAGHVRIAHGGEIRVGTNPSLSATLNLTGYLLRSARRSAAAPASSHRHHLPRWHPPHPADKQVRQRKR